LTSSLSSSNDSIRLQAIHLQNIPMGKINMKERNESSSAVKTGLMQFRLCSTGRNGTTSTKSQG
jgi:hypothetical protein